MCLLVVARAHSYAAHVLCKTEVECPELWVSQKAVRSGVSGITESPLGSWSRALGFCSECEPPLVVLQRAWKVQVRHWVHPMDEEMVSWASAWWPL